MNAADLVICQLVEDVTNGRIDDAEFHRRSKLLLEGASRPAQDAWTMAQHFLQDEDIRRREPDYERTMRERLNRKIAELRNMTRSAAE